MAERKPCLVCHGTEGPMIFAGEPYCCDDHRKALPPLADLLEPIRPLAQARLDAERRRIDAQMAGWAGASVEDRS